ncbi:MAG: ABC transporter transmembrane domain-containing protein, partial [Desemzia incerta]
MLKRFFDYYRPYKTLFTIDFISAVVVAVLELAFPIVVSQVTDELLPTANWTLIVAASIGMLLLYIVTTSLQFVVTYYGHKLGTNIETDMRRDLYS